MWTPQFIGISVGFFLIIVAIMGGGVEVKEIKIPRLSGWARFGSALLGAGIALASSGINSAETQAASYGPPPVQYAAGEAVNQAVAETVEPAETANSQEAAGEAPPPAQPPPPTGHVTIIDRIANDQEYERIEVYLNGVAAGRLAVDRNEPMDRLRIPADNSVVRYHLEGTQRSDQGMGLVTRRLEGQGTITLKAGIVFDLFEADEQPSADDSILQIELRPVVDPANTADEGGDLALDAGE